MTKAQTSVLPVVSFKKQNLLEISISHVLQFLIECALLELTCCDHQVEPHGQCSEWVGLRLVSSSLEEHWPGLGCIPGDESEKETHESRLKEMSE